MKRIFYLVCFLLIGIFTYKAMAEDETSKINEIKAWYKEIKSEEKKYTRKDIPIQNEDGGEESVTIYKNGNELKVISHGLAGPGDCGEVTTIYFRNSVAFFVLYESECFVNDKTTKDINRYYLDNGKLIQYLAGTVKKNIKSGTKEFQDAESIILGTIDEAQKYVK